MQTETKSSGLLTMFFVALTCVLAGGLIGGITNMINGAVSPHYFKVLMHWDFEAKVSKWINIFCSHIYKYD